MNDDSSSGVAGGPLRPAPITEADLHGYVDRQLPPDRMAAVESHLIANPEAGERVRDWQRQNAWLHGLLDPVQEEPVPARLSAKSAPSAWPWRSLAAGLVIAAASAGSAWWLRGEIDRDAVRSAQASAAGAAEGELTGFAQRAAIAHAVYSPEVRRPVEVGADQEQALVTWLTRRMGTAVKPPALASLGYELIGGRLLPGERSPVAQFMYGAAGGQRLTLYVTREVTGKDTAFRFGHEGPVNVFYWVEGRFGYAISAGTDRATLMKVSEEVYRQLKPA